MRQHVRGWVDTFFGGHNKCLILRSLRLTPEGGYQVVAPEVLLNDLRGRGTHLDAHAGMSSGLSSARAGKRTRPLSSVLDLDERV